MLGGTIVAKLPLKCSLNQEKLTYLICFVKRKEIKLLTCSHNIAKGKLYVLRTDEQACINKILPKSKYIYKINRW